MIKEVGVEPMRVAPRKFGGMHSSDAFHPSNANSSTLTDRLLLHPFYSQDDSAADNGGDRRVVLRFTQGRKGLWTEDGKAEDRHLGDIVAGQGGQVDRDSFHAEAPGIADDKGRGETVVFRLRV